MGRSRLQQFSSCRWLSYIVIGEKLGMPDGEGKRLRLLKARVSWLAVSNRQCSKPWIGMPVRQSFPRSAMHVSPEDLGLLG
jgi:hypothetical protein